MATLDNDDILKGIIDHKKEDIPKASDFFLKPGVVVNEGDDVLLTGNYTSDGSTVEGTIFKGVVDEVSVTDTQKVTLLSKADELNTVKPVGNYGNYVELVLGLVANQDCSEITIPFSSGNFSIRTDADIDTGTWSNGPGDFYPDLAARPGVINTGIYDDTMIYGLGDHSLPGPEHYQIWRIDVIVHMAVAAGGWLYVYLLKDGNWIERHLAIGDGWVDKVFRFEREGFDETDINDMRIKFTSDANGTWIDEVEVVINWESYDDLEKTITEVSDQVFRGEKTAKQIFNWAKLQELKTWYLDPDLNFYFNDGDIDSGVDISPTDKVSKVKGSKQIKSFDRVVLLGGYVNGIQITSTSGAGDVIYTDTFANIIDQTTLDNLADQILVDVALFPLRVKMFRTDETTGFIQPGEEVSIEAGIQFSQSSVFVPANQYNTEGIKYYIVNGEYVKVDLTLVDGLTFKKKESETPQDEETQTLISQNAQAIQEVREDVLGGAPDHNDLDGLNDGVDYEHITQTQKDALHSIYSLEQHDNAYHSTNYHTEAAGTGVVTVHSDVNSVGSGAIITTGERNALHTIYSLEQHDNNFHSTNYEVANANIQSHVGGTPPTSAHHVKTVKFTPAEAVQAVEDTGLVMKKDTGISFEAVMFDQMYSGICIDIDTTGCATYDLVYCDNADSVLPANANSINTMPAMGIVVDTNKVMVLGTVHDDPLLVPTTPGAPIYVDTTNGKMTQTPPSGEGDVVQVVGICIGNHIEYVNLSDIDSGGDTKEVSHAYVEATALTLTQTLTTRDISLGANYGLHMNGNPADDTYTGIILDIDTSGCGVGQPVYIDGSNSVAPAQANAIGTMPCIGICVAAGKVLTHGVFRDDSGLVLTAASVVYVNDASSMITTTAPSGTGDIVQVVGIAINTDEILVSPSLDWVKIV